MYKLRTVPFLSIYTLFFLHLLLRGLAQGQTDEQFEMLSADDRIGVLKMLSAQIRNNSEKVQTWEGEVDFVLDRYYRGAQASSVLEQKKFYSHKESATPETVRTKKMGTIKFILDKSKQSHYEKVTRSQPMRYFDNNDSELGSESGPYEAVSIVTPDGYIHSLALMPEGHTVGHWTKRESVNGDVMAKKGVFDPQTHLKLGMPIWEYLDRVRKLYEGNGRPQIGGRTIETRARIKNAKAEYKIISPYMQGSSAEVGGPVGYMNLCFSEDAGFNLVYSELTNVEGKVLQRVEWDYVRLGEIAVPQEMRRRNYMEDGKLWYEAKYVFSSQKVNGLVEPRIFTYENLELLDGDEIVDEIANRKFRYEAATQTLKPVEK